MARDDNRRRTPPEPLAVRQAKARQAARWHYEDKVPSETIAKWLDVPVRRVTDLLREAYRKGLVSYRVEYVFESSPEKLEDLGQELGERAGLWKALVLRSRPPVAPGVPAPADSVLELHYQLGRLAAEYVAPLIRRSVAVGAGRGVAYTIRALRDHVTTAMRARLNDLEVFSVVGPMWVRTYSQRQTAREFVDADQNAVELADILGVPWEQVHLVWLPRLYTREPPDGMAAVVGTMARHVLGDDWEADTHDHARKVNVAIFGLGVVNNDGHYMMHQGGPQTDAIPEIRQLREEIVPDWPTAVVDVCDRFILRAKGVPDEVRPRAQAIVDGLNAKSVALSFSKLNAADYKVLVAGGAQKLEGIVEVLGAGDQIGVKPDVLVTDEQTAWALLERLPPAP